MFVGPDRVFYAGLLGRPRRRSLGALAIVAALDGRIRVTIEGQAMREVTAAVIPAYTPHSIEADHLCVSAILIEPESVDPAVLTAIETDWAGRCDVEVAQTMRAARLDLLASAAMRPMKAEDVDAAVFGRVLARRDLDPRIARVLRTMGEDPGSTLSAGEQAEAVNLSVSRFLHLFKEETGVPLRALRAWKRARHLLNFANESLNMAHLALDIGYPDSTHFSHSIRRFYGLKPRTIFSGSRELAIYRGGSADTFEPA
jgi:AraC-like DNA-binding protein